MIGTLLLLLSYSSSSSSLLLLRDENSRERLFHATINTMNIAILSGYQVQFVLICEPIVQEISLSHSFFIFISSFIRYLVDRSTRAHLFSR